MGNMNRAQRRAAKRAAPKAKPEAHKLTNRERLAIIEKNGITAKDLERSFEDGKQAALRIKTQYVMNMFLCANAIALHRKFKFGKVRIARALRETERIMVEELTTEDITERCKRETGIEISIDGVGFDELYDAD